MGDRASIFRCHFVQQRVILIYHATSLLVLHSIRSPLFMVLDYSKLGNISCLIWDLYFSTSSQRSTIRKKKFLNEIVCLKWCMKNHETYWLQATVFILFSFTNVLAFIAWHGCLQYKWPEIYQEAFLLAPLSVPARFSEC